MVTYKNMIEVKLMINKLQGFTENQIKTIKMVAEKSFETGQSLNQFEEKMVKMQIEINDLERILNTYIKPKTKGYKGVSINVNSKSFEDTQSD